MTNTKTQNSFGSNSGAHLWLWAGAVLALAAALSALNLAESWANPFFAGDAGYRLHRFTGPISRVGNRFWLPFLQGHIWIFYKLGVEPAAFRLIPIFYYGLAMSFLGLLSLRAIGRTRVGLAFSLLLVACFASQPPFASLGTSLFQELPGVAFLYCLIWAGALRLNPGKWVWLLAAVGMTVRENLWIGLLAWTLLHWRSILAERSRWAPVLTLWMIPALWMGSVFVYLSLTERPPQPGAEWPLMINTSGAPLFTRMSEAAGSVWEALLRTRTPILIAGLAAAALAALAGRGGKSVQEPASDTVEDALAGFPRFSLLTMAITYGLVILFDPWEMTFGNPRQAGPLMEHAYLWAIITFRWLAQTPALWRFAARSVLAACLLLAARPDSRPNRKAVDPEVLACHADIRRLARHYQGESQPKACISEEHWQGLRNFIAPTLYMKQNFLPPTTSQLPANCDIEILRSDSAAKPGTDFTFVRACRIEGVQYGIYQRHRSR